MVQRIQKLENDLDSAVSNSDMFHKQYLKAQEQLSEAQKHIQLIEGNNKELTDS